MYTTLEFHPPLSESEIDWLIQNALDLLISCLINTGSPDETELKEISKPTTNFLYLLNPNTDHAGDEMAPENPDTMELEKAIPELTRSLLNRLSEQLQAERELTPIEQLIEERRSTPTEKLILERLKDTGQENDDLSRLYPNLEKLKFQDILSWTNELIKKSSDQLDLGPWTEVVQSKQLKILFFILRLDPTIKRIGVEVGELPKDELESLGNLITYCGHLKLILDLSFPEETTDLPECGTLSFLLNKINAANIQTLVLRFPSLGAWDNHRENEEAWSNFYQTILENVGILKTPCLYLFNFNLDGHYYFPTGERLDLFENKVALCLIKAFEQPSNEVMELHMEVTGENNLVKNVKRTLYNIFDEKNKPQRRKDGSVPTLKEITEYQLYRAYRNNTLKVHFHHLFLSNSDLGWDIFQKVIKKYQPNIFRKETYGPLKKEIFKENPFWNAVYKGHQEFLEIFLSHLSEYDIQRTLTVHDYLPLQIAFLEKHFEVFLMLFKQLVLEDQFTILLPNSTLSSLLKKEDAPPPVFLNQLARLLKPLSPAQRRLKAFNMAWEIAFLNQNGSSREVCSKLTQNEQDILQKRGSTLLPKQKFFQTTGHPFIESMRGLQVELRNVFLSRSKFVNELLNQPDLAVYQLMHTFLEKCFSTFLKSDAMSLEELLNIGKDLITYYQQTGSLDDYQDDYSNTTLEEDEVLLNLLKSTT